MPDPTPEQAAAQLVAELVLGLADTFFAFGVVLDRAGLVTRAQLAEAMNDALKQQENRDGPGHPVPQMLPRLLKHAFSIPVFTGDPN